jgi:hypothetical protein
MRQLLRALAALGFVAAGAATGAAAAPATQIRDAVARVVILPEQRSDVKVEVYRSNPRLPLRVWRFAGRTHIDGGLAHRIGQCHMHGGQPSVVVAGLGETPYDSMPQVLVRTPMTARVFVSGAVWGSMGRSDNVEFSNAGCGDWTIANVRGRMHLSLAGAGGVKTGVAGSAELDSDGSGAIATREIAGGVTAMTAGSGQIDVASLNGVFNVSIAGSGSVRAAGGHATNMQATVAGSGGVTFDGIAEALKASILGSGDVKVTRVTGPVNKAVIGSGVVRVGS